MASSSDIKATLKAFKSRYKKEEKEIRDSVINNIIKEGYIDGEYMSKVVDAMFKNIYVFVSRLIEHEYDNEDYDTDNEYILEDFISDEFSSVVKAGFLSSNQESYIDEVFYGILEEYVELVRRQFG